MFFSSLSQNKKYQHAHFYKRTGNLKLDCTMQGNTNRSVTYRSLPDKHVIFARKDYVGIH